MESRGLIRKTKDMHKKNWARISLTKDGEAAFQRQLSQRRAMNVTACLTREEVALFNTILGKVHDAAVEMIRDMRPSPKYDPLL
jgi:DNA-binding MarR family transcriptional regulator